MKNKNKRELEKYWADNAAKKAKAAKKQATPSAESKAPKPDSSVEDTKK